MPSCGSSPNRFIIHLTISNSPSRPRGAFLRPGFASLLRSPELRGSGAPRDVRVFARHPLDVP
jgi:hypothetical protein